jgi:hypothetical protein
MAECCLTVEDQNRNRAEVDAIVRRYLATRLPGRTRAKCSVVVVVAGEELTCPNFVDYNGYCTKHRRRLEVHGDPIADWVPTRNRRIKVYEPCKVDGCENPWRALGWCVKHYQRFKKYGDPLIVKGRGRGSAEGFFNEDGYRLWYVAGRGPVMEHRIVMEQHLGRELDDEETVHHVDLDKVHNCFANLELWSSRHPKGARVEDLIERAVAALRLHAPHLLAS